MQHFSSFFRAEYLPDHKSDDNLRTKMARTQAACGCMDAICYETVAIDPVGVIDTSNGQYRGCSPVLFIGEDGKRLPCLSHMKLPPIEELEMTGPCKWTEQSMEACKMIGATALQGLYNRRCVECDSSGIDGLRFKYNGKIVARPVSSEELLPSGIDSSYTLLDLLQNIKTVTVRTIEIPGFSIELGDLTLYEQDPYDLTPFFQDLLDGAVRTFLDSLFGLLRPQDFSTNNPSISFSNTTIAEIMRVIDVYYQSRLAASVHINGLYVQGKILSFPLHKTIQTERPEASPIQEKFSGIALLFLSSCAFGGLLGAFLNKMRKGKTYVPLREKFAVLVGTVVFALEVTAYILRWAAEMEHYNFKKAFVHVDAQGAERFDSVIPFGFDLKGTGFIVTTYVAEISDASYNWTWLFIVGAAVSVVGLIASIWFGPSLYDQEGIEDEDNPKKNDDLKKDDEEKKETCNDNAQHAVQQHQHDDNASDVEEQKQDDGSLDVVEGQKQDDVASDVEEQKLDEDSVDDAGRLNTNGESEISIDLNASKRGKRTRQKEDEDSIHSGKLVTKSEILADFLNGSLRRRRNGQKE